MRHTHYAAVARTRLSAWVRRGAGGQNIETNQVENNNHRAVVYNHDLLMDFFCFKIGK